MAAAGIQLALPGQQLGDAQLRRQVLLARRHLGVAAQRDVELLALLGDLAEIEAHRVRLGEVAAEQLAEVRLRRIPVGELHRQHRHGIDDVGIVRIVAEQALEFGARLRKLARPDQAARILQAHFARLRVAGQIAAQGFERGLGRFGALQLRLEHRRGVPVGRKPSALSASAMPRCQAVGMQRGLGAREMGLGQPT
jgi:hypothetical protein